MDDVHRYMSYLTNMLDLEKWAQTKVVFRSFSGTPHDHRLSCGFIQKDGIRSDITNEQYDRLAMVYLLRGRGHYSDSIGIEHSLNAGDLFWRYPDRRHSNQIDPESQWLECFISVRTEWYELLKSIDLIDPERPCMHVGLRPDIPQKIHTLVEQLTSSDTPLSNSDHEFEIVSLMRQILRRNLEPSSGNSQQRLILESAREAIRHDATGPKNLTDILQNSGLSYSRLRGLFQKIYKMSPGDYRIQVRLEQACALLETTDLNLQQIADQLGYGDAFTFSKQFKKRMGVAPNQYRGNI